MSWRRSTISALLVVIIVPPILVLLSALSLFWSWDWERRQNIVTVASPIYSSDGMYAYCLVRAVDVTRKAISPVILDVWGNQRMIQFKVHSDRIWIARIRLETAQAEPIADWNPAPLSGASGDAEWQENWAISGNLHWRDESALEYELSYSDPSGGRSSASGIYVKDSPPLHGTAKDWRKGEITSIRGSGLGLNREVLIPDGPALLLYEPGIPRVRVVWSFPGKKPLHDRQLLWFAGEQANRGGNAVK